MAKRKCLGNSGSRNLVLGDLITNLILVIKQLFGKEEVSGNSGSGNSGSGYSGSGRSDHLLDSCD